MTRNFWLINAYCDFRKGLQKEKRGKQINTNLRANLAQPKADGNSANESNTKNNKNNSY